MSVSAVFNTKNEVDHAGLTLTGRLHIFHLTHMHRLSSRKFCTASGSYPFTSIANQIYDYA